MIIHGAGTDTKLDLTNEGKLLATLDHRALSFSLEGETFRITREGMMGPRTELLLGETVLASAKRSPFLNRYAVEHAGQALTMKAIGWGGRKFGLYREEKEVGRITPMQLAVCSEVVIDLPVELPLSVQIFLMWVVLYGWSSTANDI